MIVWFSWTLTRPTVHGEQPGTGPNSHLRKWSTTTPFQ
jgi:hypothetical protein